LIRKKIKRKKKTPEKAVSVEEEASLRKNFEMVFRLFDNNRDGKIDRDELVHVLRSIGKVATKKRLEKIMAEADKDQNGTIDRDEFVAYMLKKHHIKAQAAANLPKEKAKRGPKKKIPKKKIQLRHLQLIRQLLRIIIIIVQQAVQQAAQQVVVQLLLHVAFQSPNSILNMLVYMMRLFLKALMHIKILLVGNMILVVKVHLVNFQSLSDYYVDGQFQLTPSINMLAML